MSNSFDIIAPFYQILTKLVFGKSIIEVQRTAIEQLPAEGTLLIVGGGDGTLLPYIYQERPLLSILYLEASERMIALAKRKQHKNQKVTYINNSSFDLDNLTAAVVLAPFVLDMFDEKFIIQIIEKINNQCSRKPTWIVVDFHKGKVKNGNWFNQIRTALSIYFFKILGLYQPEELPDVFTTIEKLNCKNMIYRPVRSKLFSIAQIQF